VADSLRVLQVIETGGPGGAETVFAQLSGALRDRGHDVQCLVRDGSWLPGELTRRSLPFDLLVSGGAFDMRLVQKIRRLLIDRRIDIVHAHLFDGAVYACAAARSLGLPCVVTLHGQVDVQRDGWRVAIKRTLFARTVSRVVMVSEALRRELAPVLQLASDRVTVIANGVPDAGGESAATRTGDNGGPDRARLIAIGNIRAPKNYGLLLDAFAELRRKIPHAELDILGEPDRGGLFDTLKQQVAAWQLEAVVRFHGFVADPTSLLSQADVFVLASRKEGFSLATIEAMLRGVPVVCTRSGGPEEIVTDGRTGLLVPVDDPTALAGAIHQILTHPDLAHRLSVAARRDAQQRFTIDKMVDQYERTYRELLPAAR
jgi:glycosyltransferase involved in cell wall biosynthesis